MSKTSLLERLFCDYKFETLLSNDVYWVPFNYLDSPRLSVIEIQDILKVEPIKRGKMIHTLTDAIQLFVMSNFGISDDTIKIEENNLEWEHYKPGYYAVQSDSGCCASACSWFNYYMRDIYEDIGILGLIRSTSSGHGVNYIYKNGWYYIIDLQTLTPEYRDFICPQSGKKSDFLKTKFITGIFVKTRTLEDYVKYYSRYMNRKVPEHLFLQERVFDAVPIATRIGESRRIVILPDIGSIKVIEQSKQLNLINYEWAKYPLEQPKW